MGFQTTETETSRQQMREMADPQNPSPGITHRDNLADHHRPQHTCPPAKATSSGAGLGVMSSWTTTCDIFQAFSLCLTFTNDGIIVT